MTGAAHQRRLLAQWIDFPLVTMLVAILLYMFAAAAGIVLGSLVHIGDPGTSLVHSALPLVFIVAVYKLVIVGLDDRPRDDLRAAGALAGVAKGIIAGAVLFSTIVGIAALLGVYKIIGEDSRSDLLIPLVLVAIMPGFTEEIFFRGILFRWIEEFAGSWAALVVTSALFGLAHFLNPGATWFSSFAVAVEAGMLLGGTYMLTRSLWMPIGLHAAWNFVQGPIFGVPVSGGPVSGVLKAKLEGPVLLTGGSFGLEASIIAIVPAILFGLFLLWRAVRRGELMQPFWVRRRLGHSVA